MLTTKPIVDKRIIPKRLFRDFYSNFIYLPTSSYRILVLPRYYNRDIICTLNTFSLPQPESFCGPTLQKKKKKTPVNLILSLCFGYSVCRQLHVRRTSAGSLTVDNASQKKKKNSNDILFFTL